MRGCCWYVLLVLLSSPPYVRPADDSLPTGASELTLADLESFALQHNPTLVQAQMAVAAAQGRAAQAGLYPNPIVAYSGEDVGDLGTAGKHGALVEQTFVTGRKRRFDRSAAGHGVDEAQAQWEAQRMRVLNDVRAGFYTVLAAQQTVRVEETLVRIGEEGARAAEQLLNAKEVSRSEVLEARVEADGARLKLSGAQNRHWAAWRRLAILLGLPDMQTHPLAGDLANDLPELRWEEVLSRVLAQSPELAAAQAAVQRARCTLSREYAERVPDVTVVAGAWKDNAVDQTLGSVLVSVPLPLFNRNQGNISRAQAELASAQAEVARVQLDLQDRLVTVFRHYADARQQVERYTSSILPNAKSSLDLHTKGFQHGELSYVDLLTVQRTYARVSLEHLESLRQLRVSSTTLEGLLLSGGLQAPASTGGAPASPAAWDGEMTWTR